MGWGSATELFDTVLDAVLEYIPESERDWVVHKIWDAFSDLDWDTWEDSKHWEMLERVLQFYEPDLIDWNEE